MLTNLPSWLLSALRLRMANILALNAYRSALLLPNILLLEIDRDTTSVAKLLVSLILLVCWHISFRKPSHAVVSMLPFFLILPFDLFFTYVYQEPPTTAVVGVVAHSNPGETLDYLNGRLIELLLGTMVSLAVWVCALRSIDSFIPARPNPYMSVLRWSGRFVSAAWVSAVFWNVGASAVMPLSKIEAARITEQQDNLAFGLDRLTGVFPFGRILSVADYLVGENRAAALNANLHNFSFKPVAPSNRLKQIYVLVIGEASRRDRWQIEGYQRATNPSLLAIPNLVPLTDVITPWTWTDASVPVIVTRKPPTQRSRLFPEKSIVSLFKEAGFRTYWLSNQPPQSASSPLGLPASEADEIHYLNVAANNVFGKTTHDEVLIPALRAVLARHESKQFVVIHLLGSHDAYAKRYPINFERWRPSEEDIPTADQSSPAARQRLNNSYDNSILYTDHVLSQIVSLLERKDTLSGLYYLSDHGESLLDGSCPLRNHGNSAYFNFTVSAFVWLSNPYLTTFPSAGENLRLHANAKLTTANTFDSVADLAHLTYRNVNKSNSVFNAAFHERPRLVNVGTSFVDWDQAQFAGECRIPTASVITQARSPID